jgi:hypothetical protein
VALETFRFLLLAAEAEAELTSVEEAAEEE